MKIKFTILLLGVLAFSCTERKKQKEVVSKDAQIHSLPFQKIDLTSLSDFKESTENWQIVGGVTVDRSKEKILNVIDGNGVLANIPDENAKKNLVTAFDHGDIELEVDVMMPTGSNSGLYFQNRYEIQLFDSWKVNEPTSGDMGGIYQRWDKSKEAGQEGYEGHAPKINAAKAPGLWQHLKIIFHAPRFDDAGEKIKNAEFEEVWLNGILIHEDVELKGATRGGILAKEVSMAPLMIQGDHGPVAFKNLKYKLYSHDRLSFGDMKMKEFKYQDKTIPNVDTLVPIREVSTDTLSASMAIGDKVTRILDYQGQLVVPTSGEYIFDFRLNQAGGLLIINNDTVVNRDGNYIIDSAGIAKIALVKGKVPFRLIYNKHNPWVIGFSLYGEGPGIQNSALHAPSSLAGNKAGVSRKIMVEPADKAVTQRSFLMHKGLKRTHCISVGTPEQINYAYDLNTGSLLQAWSGEFLDATQMWHARGIRQLGDPVGFAISFHGTPEFSSLASEESEWPSTVTEEGLQFSDGYELGKDGIPLFIRNLGSKIVKDKIEPSSNERKLVRNISLIGDGIIWHKVASGETIEKLPDGSYIVNDESYFVDFSDDSLAPVIRKSNGQDELLVKIPTGEQKVEYSIIW
ncbi:family 16 glycoside hydrolase [Zobellia uliginosa]|uniref:family 16 glycoside hydrolase n=1 Tax=Zobellia uliginosa TaxID=143224 RepID=UPI001C0676A4|nr:family 16 glycoside hydrolase [Zobellia uliginosa]MBU2945818.1 DUF1080 domain-containing protein [Zobellia uliginosa]